MKDAPNLVQDGGVTLIRQAAAPLTLCHAAGRSELMHPLLRNIESLFVRLSPVWPETVSFGLRANLHGETRAKGVDMDLISHPELKYVVPPADMNGAATGQAPRKRHDLDCGHFKFDDGTVPGSPQLATEEQMRNLPPCRDCVSRTSSDERESRARGSAGPTGPLCPTCFVSTPLNGKCDTCD